MKTLVLDSYAPLAYFEKEKGWEKIAKILQQASEEKCRLFLSVVNWGRDILYNNQTFILEGQKS